MVRIVIDKPLNKKIRDFAKSGLLVPTVITLFVLVSLPVTLFLTLKPQDIRQRAASPSIEYTAEGHAPNLVFNESTSTKTEASTQAIINTSQTLPLAKWFIPILIVVTLLFSTTLLIGIINRRD